VSCCAGSAAAICGAPAGADDDAGTEFPGAGFAAGALAASQALADALLCTGSADAGADCPACCSVFGAAAVLCLRLATLLGLTVVAADAGLAEAGSAAGAAAAVGWPKICISENDVLVWSALALCAAALPDATTDATDNVTAATAKKRLRSICVSPLRTQNEARRYRAMPE
jgi:hypothetical protein